MTGEQQGFDETTERFIVATADAIGRSGASQMQLRYSDDEQPVVWFAVATWSAEMLEKLKPSGRDDSSSGHSEAMAAMTPVDALFRLLEKIIDGGTCTHCGQLTALVDPTEQNVTNLTRGIPACWWRYSPSLGKWQTGCEWMRTDKTRLS